jgi:cell division protein FtsN
MPRDYVKSQHKESKPVPGWIWLLSGLIIGLFVALLIYIKDNSSGKLTITKTVAKVFQPHGQDEARGVKENKSTPPPPPEKKAAVNSKPKFDFYTILPELEDAIPEQELLNDKKSGNKSGQKFILQAGSFRKFEEADKLKARLALQGIVADIQTVKINDTDTWHRVRIGPINDLDALNQTRRRLRNMGIASIVVKNKS